LLYFQLELLVFQLTNKIDTFFELYDVFQNILAFSKKKVRALWSCLKQLSFQQKNCFFKYNVPFEKL